MKRATGFWERICTRENVELAYHKCTLGKGFYREIREIGDNAPYYIDEVYRLLKNKEYVPSPYRTRTVYEPKERIIYATAVFPDRIVHHALMNVLEPFWTGLIHKNSFACIKDRGIHSGHTKIKEYMRKYSWYVQLDAKKFYPSLNHDVMKKIIRKKLKDKNVLELLDRIIDSIPGETNIPIGNFTSQWLGNLYLNELDLWTTHKWKLNFVRFCDDTYVFSNDREYLKRFAKEVPLFLIYELKLNLSKNRIAHVRSCVKAFGYRSFIDKKGRCVTHLKRRTARRIKALCLNLASQGALKSTLQYSTYEIYKIDHSLASYKGMLDFCKARRFRESLHFDELYKIFHKYGADVLLQLEKVVKPYDSRRFERLADNLNTPIFLTGVSIGRNSYYDNSKSKNPIVCILEFVKMEELRGDFHDMQVIHSAPKHACMSAAFTLCYYAEQLLAQNIDFSKVCIPVKFVQHGRGFTLEALNLE